MTQLKSFSELKASARGHLEGNYGKCAGMIIAYTLLSFILSGIGTGSFSGDQVLLMLISLIVAAMLATLPFLLKAGVYNFFIKMCCNAECKTGDIFAGFTINGKRNFLYSLIVIIIQNMALLPASYFISVIANGNISALTSFIVCFFIGLVVIIVMNLYLSQVFFLMFDFPDKTFFELVQLSVYLMRGQKLRYFLLLLTYVPLEILSVISFGIGFIWVIPYKISTLACFYLDITKNSSAE